MSSNTDSDDTIKGGPRNGSPRKESGRGIALKVAEAEQRDVGRKIARVDHDVIEQLDITSGDA